MNKKTNLIIFLISILLTVNIAFADCEVETSFIKGSSEKVEEKAIEPDILDQLKNLPFNSFNLLKKESKQVNFNHPANFELETENGKNKVDITPLVIEGGKIQALIQWTSSTGENILSSKIWFPNGNNMVFGADNGEARCTVINVSINCK